MPQIQMKLQKNAIRYPRKIRRQSFFTGGNSFRDTGNGTEDTEGAESDGEEAVLSNKKLPKVKIAKTWEQEERMRSTFVKKPTVHNF